MSGLTKTEKTAIDAGQAYVRLLDFATDALVELARQVAHGVGFRISKSEKMRVSMRDTFALQRITQDAGFGQIHVPRYLFVPFVVPYTLMEQAGGVRSLPFIMASLLSHKGDPPALMYGFLTNLGGRERTEEQFLEFFLLNFNERIGDIAEEAEKLEGGGWFFDLEISGRASTNRLSATIHLGRDPLCDLTSKTLASRVESIAEWFRHNLLVG